MALYKLMYNNIIIVKTYNVAISCKNNHIPFEFYQALLCLQDHIVYVYCKQTVNVADYRYNNLTNEISGGYPFQDFEFLDGPE